MRSSLYKTFWSFIICLSLFIAWGAAAGPAAATELVTIEGFLRQSDNGLILSAGGKTYLIDGALPSNLIGKKVRVTGVVENDGGRTWLVVYSYN